MRHALTFLLLSALMVASASAQSTDATLTGRIIDPNNAVVPGVRLDVVNVETNVHYSGETNSEGIYRVANLKPGTYSLEVSKPGFKMIMKSDVVLHVQDIVALNFTLSIGSVAESVTVTGGAPLVNTESSAVSKVIDRQFVQNLPLNGRYVFNLVKLIPGVQPRFKGADGFAEVDNQNFSQISFNGGSVYSNQIFLDGGMNTVPVHNEIGVVPMVDTVEEFRVQTNSLAAEFGQTSGGVISVVTRSGTNQFHGSLYEFFRNDILDAGNAFLTGRTKPVLRYNQYGGTFGGPLFLPRSIHKPFFRSGHDRTFFFVGYERWNFRTANINRATVPTLEQRAGDFSNTRDGNGKLIAIFDPATTRPNPDGKGGFIRDPFKNNKILDDRMDALSLRLLRFMPLPNVTPSNPFTNTNNYLSLLGFPIDQGQFSLRIDQNFSEKDKLFGRYTGTKNTRMNRAWNNGPADTDARDDQRNNYNIVVSHTHIFTQSLINELHLSGTRQDLVFQHPSFGQGWPAQLGFPAILPQDVFPPVNIDGVLSIGSGRGGFAGGYRRQHTIQVTDSVTWSKGRHVFKMGTDQRWYRLNFLNRLNPSGNFSFSSGLTNDPQLPPGTGFGFATFLLGEVSGISQSIRPFWAFHSWSNGSYIQDDFKITRRLTLNLGLRYDVASGPVERWNRSSNFDPFVINPETQMPGVLLYAGVTKDRHFTIPPKTNFGPRLGFAYDPFGDGKTAIRAGYGLIYSAIESGDTVGDNANSLGFSVDTPFAPPGLGPFKAFQFSRGPSVLLQPRGPNGGPSAFRGQNVRYQELRPPTPYVQQWNLTVQRELPAKWVITATYAGNRGVHQFGGNYDLNQLDPKFFQLGLSLQDQVTNPFFGQIKTGALASREVQRGQLLRPFPDYLGVSILANHEASSTYHSFQFTGERKLSDGLSVLLSYTNSKLIDDSFSIAGGGGGAGDFRVGRLNRRQDRAIDQTDVSQRLVVSAVYEPPFGKQRRFFKEGVLSHILGGWQLNTIVTWQTGSPLVVRGASNFTGVNWPDMVCDPTLPSSQRSASRWFKTECFRNPPNFVIGNVPRTLPRTRGPGYRDVALSVFRNQRITERINLELRGEAFNAFNFVNFNDPGTTFEPNAKGANKNPNFGKVLSSLPARRIQLGMRLSF